MCVMRLIAYLCVFNQLVFVFAASVSASHASYVSCCCAVLNLSHSDTDIPTDNQPYRLTYLHQMSCLATRLAPHQQPPPHTDRLTVIAYPCHPCRHYITRRYNTARVFNHNSYGNLTINDGQHVRHTHIPTDTHTYSESS